MTEPVNLPALFELAKKATPGPWARSTHGFQILTADSMHSITETNAPRGLKSYASDDDHELHIKNLNIIVASVNALPAIEKMVSALAKLEQEMQTHSNKHIHRGDPENRMAAAVEGVCAEELRAILAEVGVTS